MKSFTTDNPNAPEQMAKAEEMSEAEIKKMEAALKEAQDIHAGLNSGFKVENPIFMYKRGETHEQYAARLRMALQQAFDDIQYKNAQLKEVENDRAVVPATEHKKAIDKIQELRNLLIKYGMWLGE